MRTRGARAVKLVAGLQVPVVYMQEQQAHGRCVRADWQTMAQLLPTMADYGQRWPTMADYGPTTVRLRPDCVLTHLAHVALVGLEAPWPCLPPSNLPDGSGKGSGQRRRFLPRRQR